MYRSFGTMEDVSGASMFVQTGNNTEQGKAHHGNHRTPVDGKKSVGFSGVPVSGYQNDANVSVNKAEAPKQATTNGTKTTATALVLSRVGAKSP